MLAGLPRSEWRDRPPWLDDSGDALVDHPWEQIPGETDAAFRAFEQYVEMGDDRSLRALGRQRSEGGATSHLFDWSSRWWWPERIRLRHRHEARVLREAELEEIRDGARYRRRLGRQLLNVCARRIVGDEVHGVPPLDPASLSAADLARLIPIAARLEQDAFDDIMEEGDDPMLESLAEQLLGSEEMEALTARLEELAMHQPEQ